MKKICLAFVLVFTIASANAQRKQIDTLRASLKNAPDDTTRINILGKLGTSYFISNPDSCIIFSLQAYELAVKNNLPIKQSRALNNTANAYGTMGDYVKAIQMYFRALRINESLNNVPGIVSVYNNIGATYVQEQDYKNALRYLLIANKKWDEYLLSHKVKKFNEQEQKAILFINLGECCLYTGRIDSADYYLQRCYKEAKTKKFTNLINNIERDLGEVEIARKHKEGALKHLNDAITISIANEDVEMLSMSYLSRSKLYHNYKQQDSAKYYAKKAFETAREGKYLQDVLNAGNVLYAYYDEDHDLPEAYKYYKLATAAKDSLYSQDRVKQLLSLDFEEKQRKQEIEQAQSQYQEKVRTYILIAGLVIVLLLAFIFWRNSRQRQAANKLLLKQKEDIEATLSQLKLTQNQLIQSEKMASLGELTAGIAHEIQNPLNFVNNFSEVNLELLSELKDERKKAVKDEELQDDLLSNIEQNLEKIRHHGKRADGIVKGMLQHSRASSNTKEPVNINTLTDEYLRLAYHGLRAKDKSFNTELITHYNEKLPVTNVVPQDIGRVLLNLFTNAFYAVQQKQKTAGVSYKPTVEVSTLANNGLIEIKVKDNGPGVPEHIRDKIVQPFFTTKPTGEGTGLGLSISYDIIKAHGGQISIDTEEGEFTEFTITIPI